MIKLSIKELLNNCVKNRLIEESAAPLIEKFIYEDQKTKQLPLYLQGIMGLGALITSWTGVLFLNDSKLINFEMTLEILLWGLGFVLCAILIIKKSKDAPQGPTSIIGVQSSFCMILLGKYLFTRGFGTILTLHFNAKLWGPFLGLLLITSITYPFYRIAIERFLSILGALVLFQFCLLNEKNSDLSWALNLLFLLQAALGGYLYTSYKIYSASKPIIYAIAANLCLMVLIARYEPTAYDFSQLYDLRFFNGVLTFVLLGSVISAAKSFQKLKTPPMILALGSVIALGILESLGIMLALSFLILGHAKHEKLLVALGALFLPAFLFSYYYMLDLNLMTKSGVLIGSGLLALTGAFYLHVKQLNAKN